MRAVGKAAGRKKRARSILSARVNDRIALDARADGSLTAYFDGLSVELGKYSADALKIAQALRDGLPFSSFASTQSTAADEVAILVQRLARRGLLEYCFGRAGRRTDEVVIEPQLPDYWPRIAALDASECIALSRFAYLRRRGNEMVLESPRAGALFRIGDPSIAATLASLSKPQTIDRLRRKNGFPGNELLSLLLESRILFRVDTDKGDGVRSDEGDDHLVLWDFHDLLFHTHSTEGRQANPIGGLYPYAETMPPPPAVRARWPGRKIDLRKLSAASAANGTPFNKVLSARHSTRDFDDRQPITLAELAEFLHRSARVQAKWKTRLDLGDGGPMVGYTTRPYPSAGSAYELEIYLTVANCNGLARGFYHYDADRHALMPIAVRAPQLDAALAGATFAMDAAGEPQILMTIAARFDRVSWKYSSIAYALILKDVGVLTHMLYLIAVEIGLGGCAIGTSNIELFAKMTGIDFHVEGPVGQFALGRMPVDDTDA